MTFTSTWAWAVDGQRGEFFEVFFIWGMGVNTKDVLIRYKDIKIWGVSLSWYNSKSPIEASATQLLVLDAHPLHIEP